MINISCTFAKETIKQEQLWHVLLKNEDALRFMERMEETRVEPEEKRQRRLANYKLGMSIFVNK